MFSGKCYKFKRNIYLIDVIIPDTFGNINLNKFIVPEEGVDENYWQVPYMEQYFKIDEDIKICETYDEPDQESSPVRICFFLFKTKGKNLKTPYGDVDLSKPLKISKTLKEQIDFEKLD